MEGYDILTEAEKTEYEEKAGKMKGLFPSTLSMESILSWKNACLPEYRVEGDYFCIRIMDRIRGKRYYYMPLGEYHQESFQHLIEKLWEENKESSPLIIVDVRDEELGWYRGLQGFSCTISDQDSYSDYIYRRADLEESFEKQQARYNKRYFIRKYAPEKRKLLRSDENSCRNVVECAYCAYHSCKECTNGCLKDTISDFLKTSDSGAKYGLMISSGGIDIGYAAGIVQGDCFVFLFKKNCHGYRGLDEYLQTELLNELPEEVQWINYTEDMGIDGIRAYKKKLAPYHLKPRYKVLVERIG